MAPQKEGLRADAQQNRDHILEVARNAFKLDPEASLNSIARLAGVGPGTLYRHFANRAELILAVYHREIRALVDLAPALLAGNPPLAAFREWCDRLARYGRVKRGLTDALHAAMTDRDRNESYGPMVSALTALLRACEASGDFAPGADAEDVLLLLGFLWRVKPGAAGEARADRLIEFVIRGLAR